MCRAGSSNDHQTQIIPIFETLKRNRLNQSRKIYHFNPTCELAIANGSPYYQAPAILREFEEELAPILLLFASANDHVLKEKALPVQFMEQLNEMGLTAARCLPKAESLESLQNEPVNLQPWGWSPAELNYLSDYRQPSAIQARRTQLANSDLFQRKHAVQFVNDFLDESHQSYFPKKEERPQVLDTLEAIESYLHKHPQTVLKSPLSSSGRGLQVIRKNILNDSNKRWIKTMLAQQNYLIAEPLFNKKTDLSFQFEFTPSAEIIFLGISFFQTNNNGQYLGHHLNPATDLAYHHFHKDELVTIAGRLTHQLRQSCFHRVYQGFLGIDALIYEEDQQFKIQPCLEINPRFTMGMLSQVIEKKIHPESSGQFLTYYHPGKIYQAFAEEQAKKNPPIVTDQRLRKGFLSLTAPKSNSLFGAYLLLF
jgi:hypothetical protein